MKILSHILHLFLKKVPMSNLFFRLLLLHVSLSRETLDGVFACTLEALNFLVKGLKVWMDTNVVVQMAKMTHLFVNAGANGLVCLTLLLLFELVCLLDLLNLLLLVLKLLWTQLLKHLLLVKPFVGRIRRSFGSSSDTIVLELLLRVLLLHLHLLVVGHGLIALLYPVWVTLSLLHLLLHLLRVVLRLLLLLYSFTTVKHICLLGSRHIH